MTEVMEETRRRRHVWGHSWRCTPEERCSVPVEVCPKGDCGPWVSHIRAKERVRRK